MTDVADLIRAALTAQHDAGYAIARHHYDVAHREPDDLHIAAMDAINRCMDDAEIDMWAAIAVAPPEIRDAVLAGIHETPQETP